MTGYVSLDAYEQFCEDYADYENYANIPMIVQSLSNLSPYASTAAAGGLLTGVPMAIKSKIAENALREAASENLLKGGLAGAGLVGAGILGTKAVKKIIKKRKKKPFNASVFSETVEAEEQATKQSLKDRLKAANEARKAKMEEKKGQRQAKRAAAINERIINRGHLDNEFRNAVVTGKYEKPTRVIKHAGHAIGSAHRNVAEDIGENLGNLWKGFKTPKTPKE